MLDTSYQEKNRGFAKSIQTELDRLNRMNIVAATLVIGIEMPPQPKKDGIIFFRILQEFISNTVNHAHASELKISLEYGSEELIITAMDDGSGFEIGNVMETSGLLNMKNSAAKIYSQFTLTSQPHFGT